MFLKESGIKTVVACVYRYNNWETKVRGCLEHKSSARLSNIDPSLKTKTTLLE